MHRTLIIRREYLHFVPKYARYEKRHKNLAAHVSPAFRIEEGDQVTVGQCRPLSKTVSFVESRNRFWASLTDLRCAGPIQRSPCATKDWQASEAVQQVLNACVHPKRRWLLRGGMEVHDGIEHALETRVMHSIWRSRWLQCLVTRCTGRARCRPNLDSLAYDTSIFKPHTALYRTKMPQLQGAGSG